MPAQGGGHREWSLRGGLGGVSEWESRRQTSVEAKIEDGFIALCLLPQKGLPGGPAHGRGAARQVLEPAPKKCAGGGVNIG